MIDISGPNSTPKFNSIITTAKELFYRYGIKRVSIEEICKKANVSKMTFYKHFGSKIDLVFFIMTRIFDSAYKKFDEVVQQDVAFEEKVKQMLRLKSDYTESLSKEMLEDLVVHPHPKIQELVEKQNIKRYKMFSETFSKAQKKGELCKDLNIDFLMYMLNVLTELGSDPKLLDMFKDGQALAMELTNFMFYGMMPRNNEN
jgi:AcrR family transcriptional regulator